MDIKLTKAQLNVSINFRFPDQNPEGVAFTASDYQQAYRQSRRTFSARRFTTREQQGSDLLLSASGASGRQTLTYTLANARLEKTQTLFDRLTVRFSDQQDPLTGRPYNATEVLEGKLAFDSRFRKLSGRVLSQSTSSSEGISSEIRGGFDADRFFNLKGRKFFNYLTRGNDEITGSDADDVLESGRGSDLIRAGAGNDRVFAGGGLNQVALESGLDTIVLAPEQASRSLRKDKDITTIEDFNPSEDGIKLRSRASRYSWGIVSRDDGSVETWLLRGRNNLVARFLGAPDLSERLGTDPAALF